MGSRSIADIVPALFWEHPLGPRACEAQLADAEAQAWPEGAIATDLHSSTKRMLPQSQR
jgi:hypothetical protein